MDKKLLNYCTKSELAELNSILQRAYRNDRMLSEVRASGRDLTEMEFELLGRSIELDKSRVDDLEKLAQNRLMKDQISYALFNNI